MPGDYIGFLELYRQNFLIFNSFGPGDDPGVDGRIRVSGPLPRRGLLAERRHIVKLEIRTRRVRLDEELRRLIQTRVETAFDRFAGRIRRVRFQVDDVNGPKGGVDKACRIEVVGRRRWSVFLEDRDSDLRAAVDRLADRAQRAVRRTMKKMKTIDRTAEPSFT
jgi:putative sigma-54 modulation protein